MTMRHSLRVASAMIVAGMIAATADKTHAASSMTNSLTGFTGSSTVPDTQTALAAAGLTVATTTGITPGFTSDPTILFDAAGAHFGSLFEGDPGRNYLRTSASDFATVSFVAEMSFDMNGQGTQSLFFGLGAGEIALFGTPDFGTQTSSASFWIEPNGVGFLRFQTQNDINAAADTTVPGIGQPGTHRFRMTFNAGTKTLLGEIDLNYAGGPFVASGVGGNLPIDTSTLFAADGWPSEPSRIFFGGDDGVVFRDLAITVIPEAATGLILVMAASAGLGALRRRTA